MRTGAHLLDCDAHHLAPRYPRGDDGLLVHPAEGCPDRTMRRRCSYVSFSDEPIRSNGCAQSSFNFRRGRGPVGIGHPLVQHCRGRRLAGRQVDGHSCSATESGWQFTASAKPPAILMPRVPTPLATSGAGHLQPRYHLLHGRFSPWAGERWRLTRLSRNRGCYRPLDASELGHNCIPS